MSIREAALLKLLHPHPNIVGLKCAFRHKAPQGPALHPSASATADAQTSSAAARPPAALGATSALGPTSTQGARSARPARPDPLQPASTVDGSAAAARAAARFEVSPPQAAATSADGSAKRARLDHVKTVPVRRSKRLRGCSLPPSCADRAAPQDATRDETHPAGAALAGAQEASRGARDFGSAPTSSDASASSTPEGGTPTAPAYVHGLPPHVISRCGKGFGLSHPSPVPGPGVGLVGSGREPPGTPGPARVLHPSEAWADAGDLGLSAQPLGRLPDAAGPGGSAASAFSAGAVRAGVASVEEELCNSSLGLAMELCANDLDAVLSGRDTPEPFAAKTGAEFAVPPFLTERASKSDDALKMRRALDPLR